MGLSKQDTLAAAEIGTLAVGSLALTFPRVAARLAGADPDAGATTSLVRTVGMWTTAHGALLQFVDSEAERERLMMAGAAVGSGYCVSTLAAASRGRITWRGALTMTAVVGTVTGFACAYLAS